METVNLRVSSLESVKIDEILYCISLKVPHKQELLSLLPQHMQKLQYNVQFNTGILGNVGHSINLCIFREQNEPRIGIFISLVKTPGQIVEVNGIEVSFTTNTEESSQYSMSRRNPPSDLEFPTLELNINDLAVKNQFWMATCEWWEETSRIFFTLNTLTRYPPEMINEEELSLGSLNSSTDNINIKEYYMKEEFSDFKINCQNSIFPAHRIILSSRVKYFQAMFEANMKEAHKGNLRMDDISSDACKELLRFVYQGKVDNIDNCVRELFIAADKYGIADLQSLCERHLYTNLNVDNALEIYDLANNSPIIMRKAKEIILSNRNRFASDPSTLKEFTCKYPELVFELFKML